jgi:hypothetical protein
VAASSDDGLLKKDDKRFSHLPLAYKNREGKKRARQKRRKFSSTSALSNNKEEEERSKAKTKPKTILFILFHRSHCYEMMKALAACFVALAHSPKNNLSHAMPPPQSSTTASEFAFLSYVLMSIFIKEMRDDEEEKINAVVISRHGRGSNFM